MCEGASKQAVITGVTFDGGEVILAAGDEALHENVHVVGRGGGRGLFGVCVVVVGSAGAGVEEGRGIHHHGIRHPAQRDETLRLADVRLQQQQQQHNHNSQRRQIHSDLLNKKHYFLLKIAIEKKTFYFKRQCSVYDISVLKRNYRVRGGRLWGLIM